MTMNRSQLKFLLKLNTQIDRALPILETDRANFMPSLNRFFAVVSLGMEIGMKMKPGKVSLKAKGKAKRDNVGKAGKAIVENMVKVMGAKTMSVMAIGEALTKAKLAPKSKNLRSYLNMVLANSMNTFKRVGRGLYAVRTAAVSKSAKKAGRKAKKRGLKAKKAAVKSKAVKKTAAKKTPVFVPSSGENQPVLN